MRTQVQSGSLRVHAVLHPVAPGAPAFYSADQPGGWFVQLFLDTDQLPTGYGLGYEFVVRGGELDSDQTCTIRHTEGGGGPGGWGEEVGRARIEVHSQSLEITIPLAAIADDGQVNYTIESYLTVPCGECEGGVTAIWTGAMSGSTQQRAIARRVPLRPSGVRADQFFPGL